MGNGVDELSPYLTGAMISNCLNACLLPKTSTSVSLSEVEGCRTFQDMIKKHFGPYSRYNWEYVTGDNVYVGIESSLTKTKHSLKNWNSKEKTKFLCLNDITADGTNNKETSRSVQHVHRLLLNLYPSKSSFEK